MNNPVSLVDPSGKWPQWMKDLWEEIVEFFDPSTGQSTISGESGSSGYSGSITAGTSDIDASLFGLGDGNVRGSFGLSAEIAMVSADGAIVTRNESTKGQCAVFANADFLTAQAGAGFVYQNGLGVALEAKAALATGEVGMSFGFGDWQVKTGLTGDVGAIGASFKLGFWDGKAVFDVGVSAVVGFGIFVEIAPPQ